MKIGIRREDKNIWEGRVPLVPADIAKLNKEKDLEFFIQPSKIRAFKDKEFEEIGVTVTEDLSDCDMVIAVKEIPVDFFLDNKKYMFFSHTIKGQKENIPILRKILEKRATLIDYEKIIDENNRRLVFFGKYAGISGMIDSFYGYGEKLRLEGISTPFQKIKYATEYKDIADAKKQFKSVNNEIRTKGLPFPVIIGVTGYGNVSIGAQEIIDLLPVETLTPDELVTTDKTQLARDRIYKVIFKEKDLVRRKDGKFDLMDYYNHPEHYESKFTQYLEKLNIMINGVYWDVRYPRLVSCDYVKFNYDKMKDLKIIGDISCDVEGGVECTKKSTNSGDPFFVYNPDTGEISSGLEGKGPAILAVDNLPGEISRDSSTFFSNILRDFIPPLRNGNLDGDYNEITIPPELKKAVIIFKGQLTPAFKYLEKYL
ncbi:MAG: hypothetical protein ACLFQM_10790 [Fidelibacterota bacterium]